MAPIGPERRIPISIDLHPPIRNPEITGFHPNPSESPTMSFLSNPFGGGEWDLSRVTPPWGARPSIYRHLAAHARADGPGLTEAGHVLPDEEPTKPGDVRWAAGALDGVMGHHSGADAADDTAREVLDALQVLLDRADDLQAAVLYRLLTGHRALGYIDALVRRIGEESARLDADRLHAVARWLAEGAADREPVKVAVALLGILRGTDDRDLLLTLGRHDELTLFAAVALQNKDERPERALWELGKVVDGWGRIHVVERLADARDEHVRAWLLREGYRNSILYEYTALACAQGGDLAAALRIPHPDEALMRGAADLLSALIVGRGGPIEGIGAYADGAEAAELYLGHLQGREPDLEHAWAVGVLRDFLDEDEDGDGDEDDGSESRDPLLGWPQRRDTLLSLIDAWLAHPGWEARVRAGLASPDALEFNRAAEVARRFGIDAWTARFERVERGAGDAGDWWHLMRAEAPERIARVIALAGTAIPLDEVATGPDLVLGMGRGYEPHNALDYVLQDLHGHPGAGWPLIRAGLRSPSVRNRNMAIRALAAWERSAWPADAEPLVRAAHAAEPDDEIRDSLRKLLAGEPLDDEEDFGDGGDTLGN